MTEADPGAGEEPTLLNGYPTGQTPPEPLPGPTAQHIQYVSARYRVAAAVVGLPVFFESNFKQYQPWYAVVFVTGCFILLAVSVAYLIRGHRLIRSELDLGYTTILSIARRSLGIFLFHPVTKTVVASPGEPRPRALPNAPRGPKLIR